MQVLSRVLSYAVDPLGRIASNPCEGIKQLYSNDRSEIIWQSADITQLKGTCPTEIAHAVNLGANTGLRLSDLLRLSWSHVGEHAVTITTGKSRHRRTAIIPIYDELRAALDAIPRRSPVILTNSDGGPWTANSFGSAFNRAKIVAKLDEADLHFHDLRGTAVTKFYIAGIPERAIAEIMGWEEEAVSRIIRRYVDRAAVTKNLIEIMNRKKNEG
jgi:integrase